ARLVLRQRGAHVLGLGRQVALLLGHAPHRAALAAREAVLLAARLLQVAGLPRQLLLALEQRGQVLVEAEEHLVLAQALVAVLLARELLGRLVQLLGGLLLARRALLRIAARERALRALHGLLRAAGRLLEALVGQLGETAHELGGLALQLGLLRGQRGEIGLRRRPRRP